MLRRGWSAGRIAGFVWMLTLTAALLVGVFVLDMSDDAAGKATVVYVLLGFPISRLIEWLVGRRARYDDE